MNLNRIETAAMIPKTKRNAIYHTYEKQDPSSECMDGTFTICAKALIAFINKKSLVYVSISILQLYHNKYASLHSKVTTV